MQQQQPHSDALQRCRQVCLIRYPTILQLYQSFQLKFYLYISKQLPIWNIEGHGVNCIFVSLKFMDEVARFSIPDLTSSIIASSDESELRKPYLSPFLLKQQLVNGRTWALRVLKRPKFWSFFSSSFRISSEWSGDYYQ